MGRVNPTMFLYSLGLLAAIIVTTPYWLFRMAWSGKYRDGLFKRLGKVPKSLREFRQGQPTIWLHAVSVGEVMAASRLVDLLDKRVPNFPVVISTTTRTGQAMARQQFDSTTSGTSDRVSRVFYYPLDFRWIVRRYLRAVRPQMIVLMESELWPRMIVEANRAQIPVVVVNARVSDRSLPRYRALRWLWRPLLHRLTLVLAQSELDRQRFVEIGVPADRVKVAGNLKFDVSASTELPVVRALREHLPVESRILVAGSTLQGEESLLLQSFHELLKQFPDLILVLAPRHPERFDTVAGMLQQSAVRYVRRSDWMADPAPIPAGSVFLLDSVGELASVYSLGTVAFVGGSLVQAGGHNPLEPAQFGLPIVTGPYTENFRGIVATFLALEAIRITPPEKLTGTLADMLASPATKAMGQRARQMYREHAGASERCMAEIIAILRDSTQSLPVTDSER